MTGAELAGVAYLVQTGAPVLDLEAFAVACAVERAWLEANEETGGTWPEGACTETAVSLRDALADELPECGPRYCWGKFVYGRAPDAAIDPAGRYEVDGRLAFEHAWVALDSGLILDPTAGQFYRDDFALRMVTVAAPDRWRWHEEERDQA